MATRLSVTGTSNLSPRETQLLNMAAAGLTDQAISNELAISLATIATYWGRIRIKFGPLSRTEIVAKYIQSQADEAKVGLEQELKTLRAVVAGDPQGNHSRTYLTYCPVSILAIRPDGLITYANHKSAEWAGYTVEEMVGRSILDFWPKNRHQLWIKWSEEFIKQPENELYAKNQRTFFVLPDETVVSFFADIALVEVDGQPEYVVVSRQK